MERRDAVWALALIAVAVFGRLGSSRGQESRPLTDERFCADANGDGELNIADAVTIIQHLFTGESTPYCIAQGEGLSDFATRAELRAVAARVEALEQRTEPVVETGTYTGDGSLGRMIETDLPADILYLRLWQEATCGNGAPCIVRTIDALSTMPSDIGVPVVPVAIDGSTFTVDDTATKDGPNEDGFTYHWLVVGERRS